MKPKAFFEYLTTWLKLYTVSGSLLFGENVYLVPQFPAQQLSTFVSPTCFLMDNGATPYKFHPRLLEQSFALGFWLEKIDRHGDAVVRKNLEIEESLDASLRALKTLNSEKILLVSHGKKQFTATPSNYPSLLRSWGYSVLLEL